MIALLITAIAVLFLTVGLITGFVKGRDRSREGLKLSRYRDALALADDLIKTPDALDLRDRAGKLLAADRAARDNKEN